MNAVDGDALFHETCGSGPDLLVLHGGPGLDHTCYRPWLDPLADRARLVFVDLRGNGRSPPLPAEAPPYHTWIDDVERLRGSLGSSRVLLFGHSSGGFIAQEYALRCPDAVAGLILCATAPVFDFGDVILRNATARATPTQLDSLLRVFSGALRTDDELRDAYLDLLPLYFHGTHSSIQRAAFERTRFRVAPFTYAVSFWFPRFDVRDRLREIKVPTLILAGADDFMMPLAEGSRRIAAEIPAAELVVFDQSGHCPFID